MPRIHIVTDSCVNIPTPHFLQQYPVTIVPNKITIAGKVYREGIDLPAEEGMRLIAHQPYAPLVTSPSEADFVEVYRRLVRTSDAIISIHPSQDLFASWANATAAARQFAGGCPIAVIDSRTVCGGLGMLVKTAARAVEQNTTFEETVRRVRGAVERLYSIYYVETINYLLQNRIMTPSHTVLGLLLGIKPFIGVENGRLQLIEKVKTRLQAVDRLVEFVSEFADIEDVLIVQHKSYLSEQTRMVQDRLAVDFPDQHFPYAMYNLSLAALIGADATGIIVLERETETIEDDF
jgi:DegV family protein with EDD domain